MKAIILAAGAGIRLNSGKITTKPKSMEIINGISIIHYQIRCCLKYGIQKFAIVVGFQKELLIQHVLEVLKIEQVAFIENPIYDKTNTLYSLYLAKKYMCEDFIYFNADVLFHPLLLKKLVNGMDANLLLIEKVETGAEEVKIKTKNGIIMEISKCINPSEADGEFIGIAKFIERDLPCFIECLEFGVSTQQENNYFEYALNMMSLDKSLIAIYTEGLPCIEIDFPDDLKRAREELFVDILNLLDVT